MNYDTFLICELYNENQNPKTDFLQNLTERFFQSMTHRFCFTKSPENQKKSEKKPPPKKIFVAAIE
jgi:hypothetical protein